jgi:hypothetical protein
MRKTAFALLLLITLLPIKGSAQWLCPPARRDESSTVLGENVKSKPALYTTYYDSVYATCLRRISDFAATGGSTRYNPVPEYSQLQAWNRNQSLIWLASEDILFSPSYQYFKHLSMGGANVRWDPLNDSCMYYSNQISIQSGKTWQKRSAFMKVNVYTDHRDTVKVFPEYPGGLEISNEWEDLPITGDFVVLEGYKAQSGDQGNDSSEVFCLRVTDGRKGTVRSGNSTTGCSGLDDMQMSPSGRYALLHWGSGGCGVDCGVAAYDTSMNYVGAVMKGHGHLDFTIDQNGREWAVAFSTGADCGPSGAHIVKYRVPNGYDLYTAQGSVENDTTITRLVSWPDAIGGGHISGRAFGTGFIVASADMDPAPASHPATHTVPFSQEIIKVYLNSTVASPKLERLADHHSDPWYASRDTCDLTSSYWAQPHATISRDGTRVIWGSSWNKTGLGCIEAEAYVMDISNKAFNSNLVNQTTNTWVRRKALGKKADGTPTATAPGDTLLPKMDYSHSVFAPELGSVIMWGGGGDGAGAHKGNDVWLLSAYDTTAYQQYAPDSVTLSQYPQDGLSNGPDGYSFRSYLQDPFCQGGCISYTSKTNVIPSWPKSAWGMTKGGKPWSSHIYDQMAWDQRSRSYLIYGPNFMFTQSSGIPDSCVTAGLPCQSIFYFGTKGSVRYDPYLKTWAKIDSLPDLYHQNGAGEWDPINRKFVAINYDCWHSAGYVGLCGARAWTMDTTGAWVRVANPPFDAYGTAMVYSKTLHKMLVYPANNDTTMWTYDVATNTWAQRFTGWDATYGHPVKGDALIAYDTKNDKLLIHGYGGNYGTWVPTWVYDVTTNRWTKQNPPTEPYLDGNVRDRVNPIVYDPSNNVFFMIRQNGQSNQMGNGQSSGGGYGGGATTASEAEVWTYKLTSGDGRLFEPITPGAPSACSSPGL